MSLGDWLLQEKALKDHHIVRFVWRILWEFEERHKYNFYVSLGTDQQIKAGALDQCGIILNKPARGQKNENECRETPILRTTFLCAVRFALMTPLPGGGIVASR